MTVPTSFIRELSLVEVYKEEKRAIIEQYLSKDAPALVKKWDRFKADLRTLVVQLSRQWYKDHRGEPRSKSSPDPSMPLKRKPRDPIAVIQDPQNRLVSKPTSTENTLINHLASVSHKPDNNLDAEETVL